jgi:branched-chain amino acid transport system ATP-binding protein
VIGPNGAGKSTLFNLIGGTLQPSGGRIRLDGVDVTRLPEWRRARRGLARSFQHSSLLLSCTVSENVRVAAQRVAGVSAWWLPLRGTRRRSLAEACEEALSAVGLSDRGAVAAGALSHGERRQLEIAIALASRPRLLLLDEPAAGMSPGETGRLIELLANLPREITVLLIEHDLDVVFRFADAVTVLHLGRHLMTAAPEVVRASSEVQEAYLGGVGSGELFGDERSEPAPRERSEPAPRERSEPAPRERADRHA